MADAGPGAGTTALEGAAPSLTVAAVARRLGVAPATLRTWARRYGLGPTTHQAGSHRRYSPADVARLVVMRRLTHEGVPPAEAARMAMSASEDEALEQVAPVRSVDFRPSPGEGAFGSRFPSPVEARPGGGRVVPMPSAAPAVRGLARAAMSLDSAGVAELLRRSIASVGVQRTWDQLVVPVLIGIGDRWQATGEGVEVEHAFSSAATSVLQVTTARLERPRNRVPVMLACADDDQHSLPLHAVSAVLAEHGVAAVVSAVRRTGAAVVYVHATVSVARSEQLEVLGRIRPAPRVVVGGAGWDGCELPSGVDRLYSLDDVVQVVLPAVS